MSEDHRRTPRHKTLKGGRVVFNQGNSTIACTIRDLSDTGARLKVASSIGIPDGFTLVFDDQSASRECLVRRRTPDTLGVEFVV